MRHLYYCCALLACTLSYACNAYADFNVHHNNLSFVELRPKPTFGSKPAYLKLAGVTFITDSDANRFKFDSADVRTQCMALGFAYLTDNCENGTAKALCSSVLNSAGAEKYTSGCCNRKYYLYEDSNKCSNNNTIETCTTSSGKTYYHCGCNRSLYPFSGDSDCPHGNVANMINKCTTTDANNVSVTYYATCCPASYQETCTGNHLVGNGSACYRKEGESLIAKYASCSCSAHYDTICAGSGMIDPSDFCLLNGKKFTKDTNCEGLCQQTSQTNVDAEFYNKVWHCLYKEDGATIKTPEQGLCEKGDSEYYYQTCESQGYQKSEADCYNKDIILRCPQDTSKVWCLDSKYCTGYDVALDDADYMKKARVEKCPSTDQGHRYRYIEPDCNKCWSDGKYDRTKCSNKDTSAKGDSNHCCRLGYKMNSSGVCVKNTCNKTQYPYSQHPLTDIGEVETCYEGNPNASTDYSLMYDPYYGYASCKSDFSQGEIWKQADDNPRKCVCVRENSEQNWYLPYDYTKYAEPAENGFYKGAYGLAISCTDNESSYYGYKNCKRGYRFNGGKCITYFCGSEYSWKTPYYNDGNLTPFPRWSSVNEWNFNNNDLDKCVARYKHYETENGTKLGDESVKDLLVEGCNYGTEEACWKCFSEVNLAKEKTVNGLYKAHGRFKIVSYYCRSHVGSAPRVFYNVPQCLNVETNKTKYSYQYWQVDSFRCYKHCKLTELDRCYVGDVVIDDRIGYGDTKIGYVYYMSGIRRYILPYRGTRRDKNTWNAAKQWVDDYYPGVNDSTMATNVKVKYEHDSLFGKGKWGFIGFALQVQENLQVIISHEGSGDVTPSVETAIWFPNSVYYNGTVSKTVDPNTVINGVRTIPGVGYTPTEVCNVISCGGE